MDISDQIATNIVKEQELIIGPIAWEEAQQIEGMNVNVAKREISLNSENKNETIDSLVRRYERIFGRASVEVCRDAIKDIIADAPADQIPSLLK